MCGEGAKEIICVIDNIDRIEADRLSNNVAMFFRVRERTHMFEQKYQNKLYIIISICRNCI